MSITEGLRDLSITEGLRDLSVTEGRLGVLSERREDLEYTQPRERTLCLVNHRRTLCLVNHRKDLETCQRRGRTWSTLNPERGLGVLSITERT